MVQALRTLSPRQEMKAGAEERAGLQARVREFEDLKVQFHSHRITPELGRLENRKMQRCSLLKICVFFSVIWRWSRGVFFPRRSHWLCNFFMRTRGYDRCEKHCESEIYRSCQQNILLLSTMKMKLKNDRGCKICFGVLPPLNIGSG